MVTDSHSILARWRNYYSQLFNVHGATDVRQTKTDTEEPLVPEQSAFQVEMVIEKLKRHKPPDTDQIPALMLWIEQFTLRSTNLLSLRSGRSQSLYLTIKRLIKQAVLIIEAYHFCQLHTKFYPTSCCEG